MPDWLPWGNAGLRDCSRRHVLRGGHLIGHRSAGASDGIASWLRAQSRVLIDHRSGAPSDGIASWLAR